jgi:hypothetical protein
MLRGRNGCHFVFGQVVNILKLGTYHCEKMQKCEKNNSLGRPARHQEAQHSNRGAEQHMLSCE